MTCTIRRLLVLALPACLAAAPLAAQEHGSRLELPAQITERSEVRGAPRDVTLAVYSVADLTGQDRLDALARDITSGALSEETRIAALEKYSELIESGEAENAMQSLVDAIAALIQPPLEAERHRVQALGRSDLTVVGGAEHHAWVSAFLAGVRSFDGWVDVEARILSVPDGALKGLVGGRTGSILDEGQATAFLQTVEAMEGAEVITAPRVSIRSYHLAELAVQNQTAYIKDFELTVLPESGQEIADPMIDVVSTGITMSMRSVPVAEGRIAMHCVLTCSTAERPFREQTLRLGASGTPVTIQLPEVKSVRAEARFDIALGQSMVMGTVDPGDGERKELLVVLTARRMPAPAVGGAGK